jgi:hypothetical protein
MTEPQETKPRWSWWRAHELRINLIALLFSLLLLVTSIALNLGPLAGLSFLLLIFFGTYTVYAYIRRNW